MRAPLRIPPSTRHSTGQRCRVQRVREEMERADAHRLQPHYIESFFREAFRQLGGSARQREPVPLPGVARSGPHPEPRPA